MKEHDGEVLSFGGSEARRPTGGAARPGAGERMSGERDALLLLEELRRLNADLERQNRDLRRQQLELAASRDRWWDLWAHAPVGCVLLDRDGRVLDANLAATVLLGAARPRLLGRALAEWLDDEDADAVLRTRRTSLAHATPTSCRVRLARPDGNVATTSLRSTAVRGEHGRTEWFTVLVEDGADQG